MNVPVTVPSEKAPAGAKPDTSVTVTDKSQKATAVAKPDTSVTAPAAVGTVVQDYPECVTTVTESGIVFDGISPGGRHIVCNYQLEHMVWRGDMADETDDYTYYGKVYAACLGCGDMIYTDTVWGNTLADLKSDFGIEPNAKHLEQERRLCAMFGKEFDGTVTWKGDYAAARKYCSDKCRKRIARGYQHDRKPKPCQHCGETLQTTNPRAKFCSAKCRVAWNRSKTKAVQ